MTPKLMNDICRCTGEIEIEGKVTVCPARNQCLRYLERDMFIGQVTQYWIMTAPTISKLGCDSLIKNINY